MSRAIRAFFITIVVVCLLFALADLVNTGRSVLNQGEQIANHTTSCLVGSCR